MRILILFSILKDFVIYLCPIVLKYIKFNVYLVGCESHFVGNCTISLLTCNYLVRHFYPKFHILFDQNL